MTTPDTAEELAEKIRMTCIPGVYANLDVTKAADLIRTALLAEREKALEKQKAPQ